MLVNSTNSSSTPTPGSCSSISNTLEPSVTNTPTNANTNTNTNTSSSQSNTSCAAFQTQMLNSPINSLNNSRCASSRAPSILDSPTLARVERARLRLEASNQQYQQQQYGMNGSRGSSITTLNYEDSLERSILDPKKDAMAAATTASWHHQVWTHMKRLSHVAKVTNSINSNSNNNNNNITQAHIKSSINVPLTRIRPSMVTSVAATAPATTFNNKMRNDNEIAATTTKRINKSQDVPDNKAASLKDALYAQQVFSRPDMHSLLAGRIPVAAMTGPIKRGLLWQQRDRLFSRWKERYFVLTRDYLHCFKRASGSANERASDMGQFIFKVKLVDVEKVEWLNRRSYSAVGLLLGREGRVLLRCDDGLEDWFELLEECTITSKERRRALKIAQGPRSRASLAAPVSHASLQSQHFGLGSNYTSALDDWLIANGSGLNGGGNRQKIITNNMYGYGGGNSTFLFSDSVPDLSILNNENQNHNNGLSTNHSTPQKIPYSGGSNHYYQHSRYSNGYSSQHSTLNNSSNSNGFYGSPRRILINNSFGSNQVVDEEAEEGEVELRRPRIFRNYSTENGNELDRDWLYRKPRPPTDLRHSVQPMLPTTTTTTATTTTHNATTKLVNDVDYSGHDSGLDTPPSTHRPSSYREISVTTNNSNHHNNSYHHHHQQHHPKNQQQQQQQYQHRQQQSPRNSTETSISSSRGTMINSPGGSFRAKQLQKHISKQITQTNALNCNNSSRSSVQEQKRSVLKIRNEEIGNRTNQTEYYDPNQNRYYITEHQTPTVTPQHTPIKMITTHNTNSSNNNNGTMMMMNGNASPLNGSTIFRERYQHPALAAIINESQGLKFRDRSYSDCQQLPARRNVNNNPSPLTNRRNHINPIFGTPTRV